MNALIVKMYSERYLKVKEQYIAACIAYIKLPGRGSEDSAPCIKDFE